MNGHQPGYRSSESAAPLHAILGWFTNDDGMLCERTIGFTRTTLIRLRNRPNLRRVPAGGGFVASGRLKVEAPHMVGSAKQSGVECAVRPTWHQPSFLPLRLHRRGSLVAGSGKWIGGKWVMARHESTFNEQRGSRVAYQARSRLP